MAKKAAAPATIEEKMQAALVPAEEQPYAVPGNWCWVRFGNLATEMADGPFGSNLKTEHYTSKKEVRIIQLSNIGDEGWREENTKYTTFHHAETIARSIVQPGNLVIAKMMPAGRAIICPSGEAMYILSSDAVKVVPHQELLNRFLCYSINSFYFRNLVQENTQGITRARTSIKKLKLYPFALPPLAEQRRIVDRIETMFAKLDEAKEKAQAVIDGYEYRRAAILYRAFAGELTKEWENKHISNDFSPWQETKFGDIICSIEAGKNWNAEGRPPEGDEFGVVKVSSVTWGEFDELESKTCMIPEQWNPEKQIRQGDFLFSRANTLQLVGNCVIVKSVSRRLMLSDKILRFHFTDSILPAYILYFTRSQQYRRQIEELASGNQDGMRNVSQQNLRKVQIPTPSKAEQREIVRILDDFLAKEAAVKEAAETTLATIDTMKQSILSRAFRGELGTNDPNDEPAEELLKRVLA